MHGGTNDNDILLVRGTPNDDSIQLSDNSVVVNCQTVQHTSFEGILGKALKGDDVLRSRTEKTRGVLRGGRGNDILRGGAGDEILSGGLGNDRIIAKGGQDTVVGGPDHDHVNGGVGSDIVDGGAGNDKVIGSRDRDILIGELGFDLLRGNDNDDILIAGYTSYRAQDQAMRSILLEWNWDRSYRSRVRNIQLGGGTVLRGTGYRLQEKDTDFNDPQSDRLNGGFGQDWIFADAQCDTVTDR